MKISGLFFLLALAGLLILLPARANPVFASGALESRDLRSRLKVPSAYTGCGGVNAPVVNAAYEQQIVDLVNSERANQNLPPLKRATELDQAARYHATDMGQDNYFDHDSYDRAGGNLVFACQWSSRVASFYPNWLSMAENIAAGYTSPQDAMNGWMNSSGHRANILSTSNWEIGVGYYEGGGSYYRYWVQDFGKRSNVYPLIINRDAAATSLQNVSIYIYGSGTWQEMRLKNDNGAWGNWQTFQSGFNWTIGNGAGNHSVTAELRIGGATATTSDTIYFNGPVLGNIPDAVAFTYSNADQALLPPSYAVTPLDIGGGSTLTWSISSEGTWFTVSPTSGTTPNSFTITPSGFTKEIEMMYTGAVTVTVTSPSGVTNSPKRTALTLRVTNQPLDHLFLPLVKK